MSVRIYVEGGGQGSTKSACRQGFHEFFRKVVPEGAQPKIIASGSRTDAYKDFCEGIKKYPDALTLLLVDAEAQVQSGSTAWKHLKEQPEDRWERPEGVTDDQAQLMVQCMEAWFLTDKNALSSYYGEGFKTESLPGNQNVELISKADVHAALKSASRLTQKGTYHKTHHGFDILARIDPEKVRAASAFAHRLCALLS